MRINFVWRQVRQRHPLLEVDRSSSGCMYAASRTAWEHKIYHSPARSVRAVFGVIAIDLLGPSTGLESQNITNTAGICPKLAVVTSEWK
jgi:hypothetical protein